MSAKAERIGGGVDSPLNPEVFDPASVEVRFGDPIVNAPRLRELFTQRSTIEHLADITPYATVDQIRRMYRGARAQRPVLLTAETPSGLIVGTYTAQPPGRGSRAAEGGLLAVDESCRRKGVASKLIKAGNALMCREGDGGFDCNLVDVYVIIGVNSYSNALDSFRKEGFEIKEQRVGGTHSWSHELQEIVDRTSLHMTLERRQYKQDSPGDHIKYFPTQRPPKST